MVRYGIAVVGFIAIAMVTKEYLAFTWGPLYFVTVLEIIPRSYRWLRDRRVRTAPAGGNDR
jgi:hypothetical protein